MKRKLTKINKRPRRKRGERELPDVIARADDAFGTKNYAEFSVKKKVTGLYLTSRVLTVVFYVFATLAYILLCSAVKFFLWFLVILPVFVAFIIYATWWRVSIDYKYTVDHATFTVKTVYGDRYEATELCVKVRDISLIAPYSGEYKDHADSFARSARRISAVSCKSADDIYFACCEAPSGKQIVFFEMTSHALCAFKYYNPSAVVISDTRR